MDWLRKKLQLFLECPGYRPLVAAVAIAVMASSCKASISAKTNGKKKAEATVASPSPSIAIPDQVQNSDDCPKSELLEASATEISTLCVKDQNLDLELSDPNRTYIIKVTSGALSGMVLTIPEGSFENSLAIEADRGFSTVLIQLWTWLNDNNESTQLNLKFSENLKKNVQVRSPDFMFAGVSAEERQKIRLRTYVDDKISGFIPQANVFSDAEGIKFVTKESVSVEAVVDTTPPVLSFISALPERTNSKLWELTLEASEELKDFGLESILLSSGEIQSLEQQQNTSGENSIRYSLKIAPAADGIVTIRVLAAKTLDQVRNALAADLVFTRTLDTAGPIPVLSSSVGATTNLGQFTMTLTVNEAVLGVGSPAFNLTNCTISNLNKVDDTQYTFLVNPLSIGTVNVALVAGALKDLAENPNLQGSSFSSVFDPSSLTVVVSSTASNPTSLAPISITATFSTSVNDFTSDDINLLNGSLANFAGSGAVYTFDVSPSSEGTFSVSVPAGVATNLYGTTNTLSNTFSGVYDVTPPNLGGSGNTFTSGVTPYAATLNWVKSTDNLDAQSDLHYQVFMSSSNNMASIADAENNGVVVQSYVQDIAFVNITGLSGGTNYFFTLIVKDRAGNKSLYGTSSTTTPVDYTLPVPGNAGEIDLSDISDSSMTLHWTKAADHHDLQRNLMYEVRVDTSNQLETVTDAEVYGWIGQGYMTDINSATISGLSPNTMYYFNVIVKDSSGNKSAYRAEHRRTAADTTEPTPGNSGTITAIVSGASVDLAWTKGTDNVDAPSSLQYNVYRSLSNNISTVSDAESNGTEVTGFTYDVDTATIGSLDGSTTYFFNVIVKDTSGYKSIYTTVSATTQDTIPPIPGNAGVMNSSNVTPTSIALNWAKATDNETGQALLQYAVYQSTTNNIETVADAETNGTLVQANTADIQTLNVTGLSPNTAYYFNVIVTDGPGNKASYVTHSQTTAADITPPNPGNLGTITTSSLTSTAMVLNWTQATDDLSSQSSLQYQVYRSTSNNIDSIANAEANGTIIRTYQAGIQSFSVTGLTVGTTYYFNVIVRDLAGNKSVYATKSEVTPDTTTPSSTNYALITSNLSSSGVTIGWTKATDNFTAGANLTYEVRRSSSNNITSIADAETNGAIVRSYTQDIDVFTDGTVLSGGTYYYNVIVKDQAGNKKAYMSTAVSLPSVNLSAGGSVASSHQRKSFYDHINSRHWQFYFNGTAIEFAYSVDKVNWTVAGTLAYSTPDFSVAFDDISSTGFVFLAVKADSYDIVLRRGTLTSSSITFSGPQLVFDGASSVDSYTMPTIALDGANHLWMCAVHKSADDTPFIARVRRSTNAGDGDLASWNGVTSLGSRTMTLNGAAVVPKGGAEMYALVNGDKISGYLFDGTSWNLASAGGSGYSWLTFSEAGFNGQVTAIGFVGTEMYVAGSFTAIDGQEINGIAKWDGTRWSGLGLGLNGAVNVMIVDGTDIYVGGYFTAAGGVSANRIAKWNGSSWSALGSGADNNVHAIAVMGSDVFAGGEFTTIGGISANRIAKWDGSAWTPLGVGVDSTVSTLLAVGSELFVGGYFSQAGGVTVNYIAKWDGSSWSGLGSGMTGTTTNVRSLVLHNSEVYAGGRFTSAGGVSASNIAKWDGSAWSALGSGLNLVGAFVLASDGTDLIAGGFFSQAGGSSANRIARWNGSSWSAIGTGLNNLPYGIAFDGASLYVGGSFSIAGGSPAKNLAKWSANSWSAVNGSKNTSLSSSVADVAMIGSDVYVGGEFLNAGGITVNRVAKWDGTAWSALGTGMNSGVAALAAVGTNLYAAGSFTTAGGVSANRIAMWNGSSWSALGSGLNDSVASLVYDGTNLFVGGSFTQAGGSPANNIAQWNGAGLWSALGSGTNLPVYGMDTDGTNLYVGGHFTSAGGAPANHVAQWNGTAWSALGSGTNAVVYAIEVDGSDVYAGGAFSAAGGTSANYIAKWNGTTWSALGTGVNNSVNAIEASGGAIYVGGAFSTAGGVAANKLAVWNGSSWNACGSGFSGYSLTAIKAFGSDIYVGGDFVNANGLPSTYFTIYKADASAISQIAASRGFSVASNVSTGEVYLLASDTASTYFHKYSAGSWSSVLTLETSSTTNFPTISLDESTGDLFALWTNAGAVRYGKFTSATNSWSAVTDFYTVSGVALGALNSDLYLADGATKVLINITSGSSISLLNKTAP